MKFKKRKHIPSKILALCFCFAFAEGAFAKDPLKEGLENIEPLLSLDKLIVCPAVCSKILCKAIAFQKFCEEECKSYYVEELPQRHMKQKYIDCLAVKSVPIPPLHLATEAIKGVEKGALLGGLLGGGLVSSPVAIITNDEIMTTLAALLGSVPGAVVGAPVGAVVGLGKGVAFGAFEGAHVAFCYGICTEKLCRNPSVKGLCRDACADNFSPLISKCLGSKPNPSKNTAIPGEVKKR